MQRDQTRHTHAALQVPFQVRSRQTRDRPKGAYQIRGMRHLRVENSKTLQACAMPALDQVCRTHRIGFDSCADWANARPGQGEHWTGSGRHWQIQRGRNSLLVRHFRGRPTMQGRNCNRLPPVRIRHTTFQGNNHTGDGKVFTGEYSVAKTP